MQETSRLQQRSTADKLRDQADARRIWGEGHEQKIKDYVDALNSIAASENGLLVLRQIAAYCAVFSDGDKLDGTIFEDRGRRKVYTRMIRPYLRADVKAKLESEL